MNWLNRWFYNKVRWVDEIAEEIHPDWKAEEDEKNRRYLSKFREDSEYDDSNSVRWRSGLSVDHTENKTLEEDLEYLDNLSIKIRAVNGGHVVTVVNDTAKSTDRSSYIITSEYQFDEALCKILTMARLK